MSAFAQTMMRVVAASRFNPTTFTLLPSLGAAAAGAPTARVEAFEQIQPAVPRLITVLATCYELSRALTCGSLTLYVHL
jgi:hypothetical protein